ncbi:DASS family sodium-coupled anion symporter [Roseomonas sp. JC162]|uniref:DASS family sodium-coupled anion symporter n=1 Tax=Neoroseomonas marina TaxID=1232220 RepID=A0A848EJ84_9PROT|nr:DASS family sodium-coupled anion symporter [Neoroseomonas marina]NMJ44036.1 DASS family sodium-coupled anion symporter [Neoroseomonas marina]
MATAAAEAGDGARRWIGLGLALAVLAAAVLAPPLAGLPVAGQRAIGILLFAVVLWVTEAVDLTVSAFLIGTCIILLVGTAPDMQDPTKVIGIARARDMAIAGFANNAVALVAAALVFAAAVTATGLDRRIALATLSRVGTKPQGIFAGTLAVGILLAFLVPSATARVSAVVPIVLGIIAAFGMQRDSRLAALLMIGSAQICSVMNIGVLTAAAQNATFLGLIGRAIPGAHVTWLDWLMAAAPFWLIMTPVVFVVLWRFHTPEAEVASGGADSIARDLQALGPMSGAEKRTLLAAIVLLGFWATETKLHALDTASSTIMVVTVLLLPRIGVMSWKQAQTAVPWGTLILFSVGIALGTVLVQTRGAGWMANQIVDLFALRHATPFVVVAVMAAFLIVVHLGFASATALSAAFIPIVISVLQEVARAGVPVNVVGLTMVLQFTISFGFMLVVNAPQNMVAFGTGAFQARDFMRSGIVLTGIGYVLILLLTATWWDWLGYVRG